MNPNSGDSWEKFVQDNLINANLLDGIFLLTSCAKKIYSWGLSIDEEECKQFIGLFNSTTEKQDLAICQRGFLLTMVNINIPVHYKVYKKTYCSMYCVSDNRRSSLIVNNLPYGVLITIYTQPVKAQDAIDLVQRACDLLRT